MFSLASFSAFPFDVSSLPLDEMDITYFTIFQKSGEVIFVPSGWHHQVFNLKDTVSINHNWINAFSIRFFWNHLTSTLESVRKEISDCAEMDGFHEQCQLILLSCAGMNYKGFYEMLCYLATKRLDILESESTDTHGANKIFISSQPGVVPNSERLSKEDKYNQLLTDLRMIKEVLLSLAEDVDLQQSIGKVELKDLNVLISRIADSLQNR